MMQNEPNFPPWLTFVDRMPDDGALLRLMVVNPWNSEMSAMINEVINTDPEGYAPGAADLHSFADHRPRTE
jgi:hypothetical protein